MGWLILGVGLATTISLLGQSWAVLSLRIVRRHASGDDARGLADMAVPVRPGRGVAVRAAALPRWGAAVEALAPGDAGSRPGPSATQALGTIVLPGPVQRPPAGSRTRPASQGSRPFGQVMIEVGGLALLSVAAVQRARPGRPLPTAGRAVERQQLKWFGSASGLAAICLFVAATVPPPFAVPSWMVMTVAVGFVPVVIAVAILRYRLYDIDRLISRTIGWAVVTAVLVAVFVGGVVVLQAALAPVTNENTLVVAYHAGGARSIRPAAARRAARGRPAVRPGPLRRPERQPRCSSTGCGTRSISAGSARSWSRPRSTRYERPTDAGLWLRGARDRT